MEFGVSGVISVTVVKLVEMVPSTGQGSVILRMASHMVKTALVPALMQENAAQIFVQVSIVLS